MEYTPANKTNENKDIVILTGAGLSSLFGLPMTSGFNSLIEDSSKYKLNEMLANFLGEEKEDIEKVMFILEDSLDKNSKTLQKHILTADKYFPSIRDNSTGLTISSNLVNQTVRTTYQEILKNAQNYLLHLKNGIYNLLDKPDMKKASTLYINILTQIKAKYPNSNISMFTTNYDLSFENSFFLHEEEYRNIGIKSIDYGFISINGVSVFKTDITNNERKHLEYYKLHGSLDWLYDDLYGCTKAGTNTRPSQPERMPILYPGVKGKPQKEPFIKLHDIFLDRLQNANRLIVLGFAFRDPYINELIKIGKMINKKIKMIYFNPVKLEDLPQESGLHEFKEVFNDDLKYIESKIDIDGSPLGSNLI